MKGCTCFSGKSVNRAVQWSPRGEMCQLAGLLFYDFVSSDSVTITTKNKQTNKKQNKQNKLAKHGDALAIFKSETINHSLTHSPTD